MLKSTPSPSYLGSTGDGGILCFEGGLLILQFSIFIHGYLAFFNSEQKEDI